MSAANCDSDTDSSWDGNEEERGERLWEAAEQFRVMRNFCDTCGCAVSFTSMTADLGIDLSGSDEDVASDTEAEAAATATANEVPAVTGAIQSRPVGCPNHKKWLTCAQCPGMDFCEACSVTHLHDVGHVCMPEALHGPAEVCSNCDGRDHFDCY